MALTIDQALANARLQGEREGKDKERKRFYSEFLALEEQVNSGKISPEEMIAHLRDMLHTSIRQSSPPSA